VKFIKKDIGDITVVEVHGKLIGGPENAESFHATFKSLVEEGKKKIIIDLRRTPWANSQGVGMLIGANATVGNAGGELVLAHVVDKINDILSVTRLLLIFKTFESLDEAVAHFG